MCWGVTTQVDLVIPPAIHDLVDDLPLAPENRTVQTPTPYMKFYLEMGVQVVKVH